jgi:hypothetical protein
MQKRHAQDHNADVIDGDTVSIVLLATFLFLSKNRRIGESYATRKRFTLISSKN